MDWFVLDSRNDVPFNCLGREYGMYLSLVFVFLLWL